MSFPKLLLAACLLSSSAAFAQTTPTSNPSTTRSTNTVGLGGTVSGTPTGGNATNAAPVRYDDPNSGMPSQVQVKTKGTKTKTDKRSSKMKSTM
jgi:hypothetical protein